MSKKDDIRSVLRNSDKPLSTNKVADRAGCDWHTANRHLKEMAQQGDVYRAKMSDRETLWWDREMPF